MGRISAPWALLLVWTATMCALIKAEHPGLVDLTATDFQTALTKIEAEYDWVLFEAYAHWCPACQAFQPVYEAVAGLLAGRGAVTPRIAVVRLDCAEYADTCAKFDVSGYPTMYLGTAQQLKALSSKGLTRIDPGQRTAEGVLLALEAQLQVKLRGAGDDSSGSTTAAGQGTTGQASPAVHLHVHTLKPRSVQALADLGDIEGATVKSWQYLVSSAALHGSDAQQALAAWVQLLATAHPIQRCRAGAQAAAARLPALWPSGAEAPVDQSALAALQVCAPAAFTDWGGCKGSKPSSRGYTCGLWQLLHSLAVNMPDAPGAGAAWVAAVRGYVRHYFQCIECSRHFTAHATSPEAAAVSSKRDAVLWLWRTHNLVNERLVKEDEEGGGGDPAFPHVQWPTAGECPVCHQGGSADEDVWSEDAVYAFLLLYYGAGDAAAGVKGAAVTRAAAHRSQAGGWGDAVLIFGLVAAAVYGVLRNSGQYALRKASSRLL